LIWKKNVSKHFSWADYQEANFWFTNENGETTRVATDEELLSLLRASKIMKFIMTIDRCEHVNVESQVIAEDNNLQLQVIEGGDNVINEEVPCGFVLAEYEGRQWANEPELGVTAADPARVEDEEEHYLEPGFDPEGDDPTGADEEWRYFKKQQKATEGGANDKVQQEKKKGEVYEGTDPDVVPSDEATMMRDAACFAHTTYDRDNPVIKQGSTFADKDAFLLIIKQYAIKREFQTFVEHSDSKRYRAKCADSECEWKVYAKKLLGCPTFMVYMCYLNFRLFKFHINFRLLIHVLLADCFHFRRTHMCQHKPIEG
jgi:hypothetical protein